MAEEVYVSIDFEAVNPTFGAINLGAVAAKRDGVRLGRLDVNFALPEDERADPDTVRWFQEKNAEAWARCTRDPLPPAEAMKVVAAWFADMARHGKLLLVAYPTIYDGTMLYNYWFRYLGHPNGGRGPGFTVMDIRSYAAGKLGISYNEASKERALAPFRPAEDAFPHTHCGIDDAEEQLELFLNLLRHDPGKQKEEE
jgi:hypothetical protein